MGRRPAVPPPGVRAHPPRARPDRDGGRHDVPLRHRRHRGRAGAGDGRGRRHDVRLGGGAATVQQYLRAGLVDELRGRDRRRSCSARGERLFEDLDGGPKGYECVELCPRRSRRTTASCGGSRASAHLVVVGVAAERARRRLLQRRRRGRRNAGGLRRPPVARQPHVPRYPPSHARRPHHRAHRRVDPSATELPLRPGRTCSGEPGLYHFVRRPARLARPLHTGSSVRRRRGRATWTYHAARQHHRQHAPLLRPRRRHAPVPERQQQPRRLRHGRPRLDVLRAPPAALRPEATLRGGGTGYGAPVPSLRWGLSLSLSEELADPVAVAALAADAEAAGWDGVFVWDHLSTAPARPSPTPGSRSPRSRRRRGGCGSARW